MKVSTLLKRGILLAAIMAPLPVLASPGYIPTTVNLRAGPATFYPVVNKVSGDRIAEINGCLRDFSWCEVTLKARKKKNDKHGWISGRFLQTASWKNRQYIITPREPLNAPVIRFDIVNYWDAYYRNHDFYSQRHYYYTRDRNQARNDDWRDRDQDRNWRDRDRDRNWDDRNDQNWDGRNDQNWDGRTSSNEYRWND